MRFTSLFSWSWSRTRDPIVCFAPTRRRDPNDAVAILGQELRSNGRDAIEIASTAFTFPTLLQQAGIRGECDLVVVFAHPAPGGAGFEVNPTHDGRDYLSKDWWGDTRIQLLVAFTCEGMRVLSQPGWQEVFLSWVSWDREVKAFLITRRGREVWGKVASECCKQLPGATTAAHARKLISEVYVNHMEEINETIDTRGGDELNLMYLQQAHDALVAYEGML